MTDSNYPAPGRSTDVSVIQEGGRDTNPAQDGWDAFLMRKKSARECDQGFEQRGFHPTNAGAKLPPLQ
jgi:hypothetical protein